MSIRSLKWILIVEMALSSLYIAMTRGVFLVYLAEKGLDLAGVALVSLGSGVLSTVIGVATFKRPELLSRKFKLKLISAHGLERLTWIPLGLIDDILLLTVVYAIYSVFQAITSLSMNLVIFGSFNEEEVRDVVAKRVASGAAASIIGLGLATALLGFLEGYGKYHALFLLGSGVGLLSTALTMTQNLSHLEGLRFPCVVEERGRIFAASTFQLALSASGALFSMAWTPFLIHSLGYPAYLAAAMGLVGTASSVFGAPFWRHLHPRKYRIALLLNAVIPILVILSSAPWFQLSLSAMAAFSFSGASLLGTYLFARYNRWLGAIRSSALALAVGGLAQLVASGLGLLLDSLFSEAFAITTALKFTALAMTALVIPEVAIVPPHIARAYANAAYGVTLMGYRVSVAITKETLITVLRILALTFTLLTLYVIYRTLSLLLIW